MVNFLVSFFRALKLPLKLLIRKKKRPKVNERERKLRAYVWNFSPSRLKNRSWQNSLDKKAPKKRKKTKKVGSPNSQSVNQ